MPARGNCNFSKILPRERVNKRAALCKRNIFISASARYETTAFYIIALLPAKLYWVPVFLTFFRYRSREPAYTRSRPFNPFDSTPRPLFEIFIADKLCSRAHGFVADNLARSKQHRRGLPNERANWVFSIISDFVFYIQYHIIFLCVIYRGRKYRTAKILKYFLS